MKAKSKLIISICIILVLLIAIYFLFFNNKIVSTMSNKNYTSQLTAEEIITKMKDKGLNIGKIIVYNEENDLNNLLGRPNQYISKISFEDTRISQEFVEENDAKGGTIEVFNNKKDMENRKKYIESISSSASIFAEYIYNTDYALLRLQQELTPSQAQEYETAFYEILEE